MQIKAEQKNSRQSPRKIRLLANQVKKLSLQDAFSQLALMERKASLVLLKVMRQAVANAVNNNNLLVEDLEIDNILVKTGPTYKRWQPVSRGRAHKILKRSSHIEVVLKTKKQSTSAILKTAKEQTAKEPMPKIATKKDKKIVSSQNVNSKVWADTRTMQSKLKDQGKASTTMKKSRSTRIITSSK